MVQRARLRGLALGFALLLGGFAALPVSTFAQEEAPAIVGGPPEAGAEAYLVMDAATGQVLAERNAHEARYPASITKIMTLGLALEQVGLGEAAEQAVTVSQAAVDALIPRATMVSLQPGEVGTFRDMLYATMIESANDASHVIAEHLAGSMGGFAGQMNDKLAELGLSGSHFSNPSGQPADDHFVTAYDMAAVTRWALEVPGFRELFASTEYAMGATNKAAGGRVFHNSNLTLAPGSAYYCEGVTGSKSGYTDLARYTLVTTARRGDTELICVVLNCASNSEKYTSTGALLDYCFASFSRVSYPLADLPAQKVPVYGGGHRPLGELDVFGQGEVSFLLHHSLSPLSIELRYEVPQRYLIGDAFEPRVALYLPEEAAGVQPAGELASLPLGWSGLEEIMAANTTAAPLKRLAEEEPALFGLALAALALGLGLVVARAVYVRARRHLRRKKRLAAARAQMPVRIAARPEPPAARQEAVNYRAASQPHLRVEAGGGAKKHPRRSGRA